MQFVLLDDIKYILTKQKKYLFMYFGIMLAFFAIQNILGNEYDYDILIKCLGLDFRNRPFLNIIMFGFHLAFFLYIAISLFTKNLANSQSNLLLRIGVRRWFAYKLISIHFIIITIELLNYLFIFLFMIVKLKINLYTFELISINLLFILSCSLFLINCYIYPMYFSLFLIYAYFIYNAEFKIININTTFLILSILFNVISGIYLIKINKYRIFEKI